MVRALIHTMFRARVEAHPVGKAGAYGTSSWTGFCADLGQHNNPHELGLESLRVETGTSIFWLMGICYCLERLSKPSAGNHCRLSGTDQYGYSGLLSEFGSGLCRRRCWLPPMRCSLSSRSSAPSVRLSAAAEILPPGTTGGSCAARKSW